MKTEPHWIEGPWPGKLGLIPRPRGGDWLETDIVSWRRSGVGSVVSFLTQDEARDLELAEEASLCKAHGLAFISFPIADRGVPSSWKATADLVGKVGRLLARRKNVALHCRQGIGRSALIAACLLADQGMNTRTAFKRIGAARGCAVPETPEQEAWVAEFALKLPAKSQIKIRRSAGHRHFAPTIVK